MSDLFWYWLAPGPQMHQEHLEPGDRYQTVARTTRKVLAVPHARSDELATEATRRILDPLPRDRTSFTRLRDLMMPVWAEVYYELVFGEACPPDARALIVANADDVVNGLKCTGLRHPTELEDVSYEVGPPPKAWKAAIAFYLQGLVPHAMPSDGVTSLLQGMFQEKPPLWVCLAWLFAYLGGFLYLATRVVERKEYILEQ